MLKFCARWLLGSLILLGLSNAHATDLLTIYHQALKNDAEFQSATAARRSIAENLPQSWAGLLPNLGVSANILGNRQYATPSTLAAQYHSKGYNLNLSQAVLNISAMSQVQQARDTVAAADANYAAAAQNLLLRVATAYFNVLKTEDNLRLTRAQQKAVAKQLEEAKVRFDVGVDAINSVDNAQATYDSLIAQEISDKNSVVNSYEALKVLTDQNNAQLATLTTNIPLLKPEPNNVGLWLMRAEQNNATLKASQYTVNAARINIKTQFAQHFPSVNLVGSYIRDTPTSADPAPGQPTATRTGSLGLQMNLPILQGGLVNSQTRQAAADYAKASADMESTHRNLVANVYQTYNNVLAGISKIKADQQVIKSKQTALDSNEAAMQAGTMTILDVLDAEQDLFDAQRTYASDQYDYLLNTLLLKQLAGTLNELDLLQINTWLQEPSLEHPAPPPLHRAPIHKKTINKKKIQKRVS